MNFKAALKTGLDGMMVKPLFLQHASPAMRMEELRATGSGRAHSTEFQLLPLKSCRSESPLTANVLEHSCCDDLRLVVQGNDIDLLNAVPQNQPLDERQVLNAAGGYVLQVTLHLPLQPATCI